MGDDLHRKLEELKKIISRYPSALIAFSGGVDSTFLAAVAREVLGDRAGLVTAHSPTYPAHESDEAKAMAEKLGMRQLVITTDEMSNKQFVDNPPDRCYYCKHELFTRIRELAKQNGFEAVFEGSNRDDLQDYRPGRRAIGELHIVSPLLEAQLGKDEIRELSRERGLPTAGKPSFACLASRFPYGEEFTLEKISRVEEAEEQMRALGFTQFRVRSHGDMARIELVPAEQERGWEIRHRIDQACRAAGFAYVTLDIRGYRTGAMNEVLSDSARVA